MPCFIIASISRDERVLLLSKLAEQLGHPPSVVPDLDTLLTQRTFTEAGRPLVLVADFASSATVAESAVRFAQNQHDHAYVVYIADTIPPEIYKQLVRTNAGEWISWRALPRELSDVARAMDTAPADASSRAAKVLSYLPSKGGVGNTTLAQETAVYLASRRNRSGSRVAILDLNLEGGTLADALDVQPRFDVREIMGQPERLDEQLVDIFTSRYSAQLDVFASPLRRMNVEGIEPQVIFLVLDAIANRYDLILVDIPNQRLPWTDNVLQGSDIVVVTGGSTVPALKQLGAKLSYLDEIAIPAEKVATAVSQCDTNLLGRISRRSEIDGTLPGRRVFHIRRDVRAFEDAANTGRSLMDLAPRSGAAKDIRRLAQWLESAADGPLTDRPVSASHNGALARGLQP